MLADPHYHNNSSLGSPKSSPSTTRHHTPSAMAGRRESTALLARHAPLPGNVCQLRSLPLLAPILEATPEHEEQMAVADIYPLANEDFFLAPPATSLLDAPALPDDLQPAAPDTLTTWSPLLGSTGYDDPPDQHYPARSDDLWGLVNFGHHHHDYRGHHHNQNHYVQPQPPPQPPPPRYTSFIDPQPAQYRARSRSLQNEQDLPSQWLNPLFQNQLLHEHEQRQRTPTIWPIPHHQQPPPRRFSVSFPISESLRISASDGNASLTPSDSASDDFLSPSTTADSSSIEVSQAISTSDAELFEALFAPMEDMTTTTTTTSSSSTTTASAVSALSSTAGSPMPGVTNIESLSPALNSYHTLSQQRRIIRSSTPTSQSQPGSPVSLASARRKNRSNGGTSTSITKSESKTFTDEPSDTAEKKYRPGSVALSERMCDNCKVTETTLWRRVGDLMLCNPCGLYLNTHKVQRPASFIQAYTAPRRRRSRSQHTERCCFMCGVLSTPIWRRDEQNRTVCNACGLYLRSPRRNIMTSVFEGRQSGQLNLLPRPQDMASVGRQSTMLTSPSSPLTMQTATVTSMPHPSAATRL